MKGFATYGFLIFLIIIGAFYMIGDLRAKNENNEQDKIQIQGDLEEIKTENKHCTDQNQELTIQLVNTERDLLLAKTEIETITEDLAAAQQLIAEKEIDLQTLTILLQDTQNKLTGEETSHRETQAAYKALNQENQIIESELKNAFTQIQNYQNVLSWLSPLQQFSSLIDPQWLLGSILTSGIFGLTWVTKKKISQTRPKVLKNDPWQDPEFRKLQRNRAKANEKRNRRNFR